MSEEFLAALAGSVIWIKIGLGLFLLGMLVLMLELKKYMGGMTMITESMKSPGDLSEEDAGKIDAHIAGIGKLTQVALVLMVSGITVIVIRAAVAFLR